ncbi:MAG: hypothetical protein AAB489_06085 [Patescibacteria group bacterium]
MVKTEIIDRRLTHWAKKRRVIADYLLLLGMAVGLGTAGYSVMLNVLGMLTSSSDFLDSLLTESAGGFAMNYALYATAYGVGLLVAGVIGGQVIRKQTLSAHLLTSVLVGGVGALAFAPFEFLLSERPFLTAAIITPIKILLGSTIAFFGYLYGFWLLAHGQDWLDDQHCLFGIQRRYYGYLIPGYLLLAMGASGIATTFILLWLKAGSESFLDLLPLILMAIVVYWLSKTMGRAHALVLRERLRWLSNGRKVSHVGLSILFAIILPSLLIAFQFLGFAVRIAAE